MVDTDLVRGRDLAVQYVGFGCTGDRQLIDCVYGVELTLLQVIEEWLEGKYVEAIFWLNGTGRECGSFARTVAHNASKKGILGARPWLHVSQS